MNNKEFILSCNKTCIILYENEILQRLPLDLLSLGIRRGKHYKRSVSCAKREQSNQTPWTDSEE